MVWFLGACAAAVLGLAAVAGSGRLGSLPPVVHDTPVLDLPPGPLTGADVRSIRFAGGVRGYAPAQVDEVLGRLAAQLDATTWLDDALPPDATPPPVALPDAPGEASEPAADGVGRTDGDGLR